MNMQHYFRGFLKLLAFEGCFRGLAYAIFNLPSCSHRALSLVEVARLA